jgi:cytochrome c oxidase cbb3-type subunit III
MDEIKRVDPMAGEIVHEYDGIEEADNALPTWWVLGFIATIVFAAGYWLVVERLHATPTPAEALVLAEAARARNAGDISDADLQAASHDPALVSQGKLAFATHCAACHGARAEGNIGPNLTDEQWLNGGAPAQVFATIKDGVPAKGMPTWGPLLGAAAVRSITAYVLTVRNSHVPGKPPQGDVYAGN